jgi:hypothetical protein
MNFEILKRRQTQKEPRASFLIRWRRVVKEASKVK